MSASAAILATISVTSRIAILVGLVGSVRSVASVGPLCNPTPADLFTQNIKSAKEIQ